MDETVGNLKIDSQGECKYCKAHKEMEKEYQLGDNSFDRLKEIASKIKKRENTKYDCMWSKWR